MKLIKIAITLLLLAPLANTAFCQTDSLPIYQQYPTVPAFKLMQVDSSFFAIKSFVKKNKATVVIVFSPTCSHCQHQAEEVTSHIKQLQDVQFVFATHYPMDEIKTFIDSYGLSRFSNIIVGYDKANILGNFYKIESLPGVFVYNKKGKLTAHFDTNVKIETLQQALSN